MSDNGNRNKAMSGDLWNIIEDCEFPGERWRCRVGTEEAYAYHQIDAMKWVIETMERAFLKALERYEDDGNRRS